MPATSSDEGTASAILDAAGHPIVAMLIAVGVATFTLGFESGLRPPPSLSLT